MGVADPDHMAVMGWSYGGFMTSWTVTHTDRFKAAVVGAGVTNLWSFTGTADIPGFLPDYFGGEPWDQFDSFTKHSPITYVQNVKTPTLILHGEADVRVPTSQGYEFYHALKKHGRDHENGGVSPHAARPARAEVHSRHRATQSSIGWTGTRGRSCALDISALFSMRGGRASIAEGPKQWTPELLDAGPQYHGGSAVSRRPRRRLDRKRGA